MGRCRNLSININHNLDHDKQKPSIFRSVPLQTSRNLSRYQYNYNLISFYLLVCRHFLFLPCKFCHLQSRFFNNKVTLFQFRAKWLVWDHGDNGTDMFYFDDFHRVACTVHDRRVLKVAFKRSGLGGEYRETIARVCSDVSCNSRQK